MHKGNKKDSIINFIKWENFLLSYELFFKRDILMKKCIDRSVIKVYTGKEYFRPDNLHLLF